MRGLDDNSQQLDMNRWRVCRQDDNGNRFVVIRNLPKAEAERVVQELEGRGHKQVYWLEPEAEETRCS
jgi:hypothetical protein